MVDVREDILARLLEVLADVPNIRSAYRNNVDISEDQLPVVLVFDGDEETDGVSDRSSRPANRPYVVSMTPEIVVAEQSDEAGSDLSAWRREIIKRVLNDPALIEQVGSNGAIRYLGCQTDLGWMRKLYVSIAVRIMFRYPLKIEEL